MRDRIPAFGQWFLIAMFIAILGAPTVCKVAGIDLRAGPPMENRPPVAFPRLAADARSISAFPRKFEEWFQDHYGLRRLMIRAHNALLFFGLRTSPNPRILRGRDGWLYFNGAAAGDGDPVADARGTSPLTPLQLEQARWMFQDLNDWLAARGRKFLVVLVPNKETLYPEHLPAGLSRVLGPPSVDQVADHFERHAGFAFVNLKPALVAAKSERETHFPTDTHWNPFGAYRGYREILKAASVWFPDLKPWPEDDFEFTRQRMSGDLARMLDLAGALEIDTLDMKPRVPRRARITEIPQPQTIDAASEVADAPLPTAYFFRDSFSVALIPYLSEHFRAAYYRWILLDYPLAWLEESRSDLVVVARTERYFRRAHRYPVAVQQECAARRFESATHALSSHGASNGFAGVRGAAGTLLTPSDGALLVKSDPRAPVIEIPAIPQADVLLPIARIDVTAARAGQVTAYWRNTRPDGQNYDRERRVAAPLARGRQYVHVPLFDPELAGPLRIELGTRPGKILIHGIEVRGVSR
jgi:hypothetical protein